MTLPVPDLDDRTFQGLVDEAKRMIQKRCPEWTDHNVSDPGVTLVEAFAYMTDQLIYRVNRIPDRLFVKFLELIGVRLMPPNPARVRETFWLSAPQSTTLSIPTGTRVASLQTESNPPVVFATNEELQIVNCELAQVYVQNQAADAPRDMTKSLAGDAGFFAFSEVPVPGDTLLIGLSAAVPANAVQLRFRCSIRGVGVDPDNPPLRWEAQCGDQWLPCELDRDETGGLNRDGDVVLHVPAGHAMAVMDQQLAGWLRAKVIEADEGQPVYSAAPTVHAVTAATVGGTVEAINAEIVEREELGTSEGVAGQRFRLARFPVLGGAGPVVLQSSSDEGWEDWAPVDNFGSSGADDRHFVLDAVNGEVTLGPAVREPDGTIRHYGAVPARGALLRMRNYSIGGGRGGNVMSGSLTVLKSSIPYITAVTNRHPAHGGVDGETIEEAKQRGPITLRTKDRAVTAEDFEQIVKEIAPEIARVRAVPAGDELVDAGGVRVLCVPASRSGSPQFALEELVIPEETTSRITERLDEVRLIGTRISIEAPFYTAVTVVARLVAKRRASVEKVNEDALDALYRYINPLTGGSDGTGWPWGRPVQPGEVFGVLQAVPGVELVEDVRLYGADPITGTRAGQESRRLDMQNPSSIVFSFEHQVMVEQAT